MQSSNTQAFIVNAVNRYTNRPKDDSDSSVEEFLDSIDASSQLSKNDYRKLVVALVQCELNSMRAVGLQPEASEFAKRFPDLEPELFDDLIRMPEIPQPIDSTAVPLPRRYQIIKKIGVGGLGEVWRVFDQHMQRPLAVKLLRPERRKAAKANARLKREAMITGQLQHPGIPPVFDQKVLENGSYFFCMKLVDGQTLSKLLAEKGDEHSFLLGVFEQVAQTIAYAHSRGVIHRDIKPQNVMVGSFGEVQVMDWGMAKFLNRSVDDSKRQQFTPSQLATENDFDHDAGEDDDTNVVDESHTRIGEIVGTPAYMSPEQARGASECVDYQSDVFSLGALLFELLTNERLYEQSSSKETLNHAASANFRPVQERLSAKRVDDELKNLCVRCLQKEKAKRPADAGEVATAITDYLFNVQERLRLAEIEQSKIEVANVEQKKRVKAITTMSLFVALVSLAGAAAFGWQWNATELARRELQAESIKLRNSEAATSAAARRARQSQQQAEKETETLQDVYDFMIGDMLGAINFRDRTGNELLSNLPDVDLTMREVLDRAAKNAGARFADRPDLEMLVREQLGNCYAALALYKKSRIQLDRVIEIHELAATTDLEMDETAYRAKQSLVLCELNDGKHEKALNLINEVCQFFEATHGRDSDVDLMMRIDRTSVLSRMDQFETAEKELREIYQVALSKEEDVVGIDAIRTRLASTLLDQAKFAQARQLLEETLSNFEDVRFEDENQELQFTGSSKQFIDYMAAFHHLARINEYEDRLEEAAKMMKQRLRLYQTVLGEDHERTLNSATDLAICYLRMKRYDDAIEVLEKNIDLQKLHKGPDHDDTLGSMDALATAYLLNRRYDEAEPIFDRIRISLESKTPLPKLSLSRTYNNLGGLYLRMKRYKEAEPLMKESLDIMEEIRGFEHPDSIRVLVNLAKIRSKLGKPELAEEDFILAIEAGTAIYHPAHPEILLTKKDLAIHYADHERLEDALEVLEEVISIYESDLSLSASDELKSLLKLKSGIATRLADANTKD